MPKRFGNSFFLAPASLNALGYDGSVSAESKAPLPARHGFTVVRDRLVAALVDALHRTTCPSAILRFVVPVNINSINGRFWRTDAHVGNEVFKGRTPSFANSDAAPTVVIESVVAAVEAALNHGAPRVVGGGSKHTVLGRHLSENTSAGLGVSTSKLVSGNNNRATARTLAKPSCMFFVGIDVVDSRKTAKCLTGKVFESCHFVTSKLITVKKAWQAAVIQLFGSYPSQVGVFYHG